MQPHLRIFVAALAAIPVAATAQPTGEAAQPPVGAPTTTQSTATQDTQLKVATAADVKAGATVVDQKGDPVGTVDSVDAEGVVVSTGSVRAKIPLSSFGVGDKGLVIAATKAELEAAAKKETKSDQK